MNTIITQGLKIDLRVRYIKFTQSKYLDIREDFEESCLYIDFPPNFCSSKLINKNITVLKPQKLKETDFIKVVNPIINLNGFKFKKLIMNDYVFSQFIVKDLDQFVMTYDENQCEILIPRIYSYDFKKYECLLRQNPYFEVIENKLESINNFYTVNLTNRDLTLKSENTYSYPTKQMYTKYILDMIQVQESFIDNVRSKLLDFGLELVSLPLDKNTHSEHRVTYRFMETGRQTTHRTDAIPGRYLTGQSDKIEFKLSTPDMVIFNDFKHKYQNMELLTNFMEFYTRDKLGFDWISNVFWDPIDVTFNQDYTQDELGNVSFETPFYATINYYVVEDQKFENMVSRIENTLDLINLKGKTELQQENLITLD